MPTCLLGIVIVHSFIQYQLDLGETFVRSLYNSCPDRLNRCSSVFPETGIAETALGRFCLIRALEQLKQLKQLVFEWHSFRLVIVTKYLYFIAISVWARKQHILEVISYTY